MSMSNLEVHAVDVYYNNIRALHEVSFVADAGRIVALIGANGAGKSTLLNAISGVLPIRSGHISSDGIALTNLPANLIATSGIVQIPEGRRIFGRMTVAENLEMGAFARSDRAGIAEDREWVFSLFPRLRERLRQLAGTLSGGEQQMVATGRALMARPKILLMDEPSMGLSPIYVDQVFEVIRQINGHGVTIVLVEQNAHLALEIANFAHVLENGRIVLSGLSSQIRDSEEVKKAYLG